MKKSSQKIYDFKKRRKNNLVSVCGGACNICGYKKSNSALEFHHIDSEEKEFGISGGPCRKLETDLEEVKKCILVCANCHREIHDGIYSKEELLKKKVFLKDISIELIKDRDSVRAKTICQCLNCGDEISKKTLNGLCRKCYNEKNSNHIPNREELKKLIREQSFTSIGLKYGVSDNSIRKWCDKHNLPRTKKEIKNYSDIHWENI